MCVGYIERILMGNTECYSYEMKVSLHPDASYIDVRVDQTSRLNN
jgi:hypothetical protein